MKKISSTLMNTLTMFLALATFASLGAQGTEPEAPESCMQRFSNLPRWKKVAFGACVACVIGGAGTMVVATIKIYLLPSSPTHEEIFTIETKDLVPGLAPFVTYSVDVDDGEDDPERVFIKKVLPLTGLQIAKDAHGLLMHRADEQAKEDDVTISSISHAMGSLPSHHFTVTSRSHDVQKSVAKTIQNLALQQVK